MWSKIPQSRSLLSRAELDSKTLVVWWPVVRDGGFRFGWSKKLSRVIQKGEAVHGEGLAVLFYSDQDQARQLLMQWGDDHLWWTRRDCFSSQCIYLPLGNELIREATGPNSTAEIFKSQIILWPLLSAVIYVNQDNGKWKQINSVFQSWCSLGIGNNVSASQRKTKGQEYGFLWVHW